jgi:hypothetical protein
VKEDKEEDTAFSKRMKEWNGLVIVSLVIVAKDMLDHLKRLYKPEGISYRFSEHAFVTALGLEEMEVYAFSR